ncbi:MULTISPECIES: acyl-CoA dehydrogenase family protein [unclassified Streptomyces]|uniref:acyl-CoA dehydrogenase family protein n=1 Tax=unclassified Streptomyces TaxID=2593676 RepID=UPI000369BD26|nr:MULTISPECIES: acyl-CoA dehydrogenase family protein [unclassified Streptomyces]MYT27724.1 acyl-CoA dehydrogenase [Streptomyces sp. SID8354]
MSSVEAPTTVESFRTEIRSWLRANLTGEFAALRGRGGPGREHEAFAERLAWERHMAAAGWTCVGWPVEHGGRGATLEQQVAFHEEYALADAPARVNHIGEQLLGPTLIAFGTEAQRARFLPEIAAVRELWCQGYSEPDAGSDLANVRTRAAFDEERGDWVVDGQKIWTSLAQESQWCFVLARTEPGSARHRGLSYLLVPLDRPGVDIRPITQLTGTAEFNEVFFDGARAPHVVGAPGDGWRVAMATLGFERGVSTLGQQVGFTREWEALRDLARRNGAVDDPLIRDRLTRAWIGLEIIRCNALRMLEGVAAGAPGPEASIGKIYWATWHRELGELAMDVCGAGGMLAAGAPYELDDWQRLFLFSRADTLYAGSNEIQRNIIAERVLGLPKEAKA